MNSNKINDKNKIKPIIVNIETIPNSNDILFLENLCINQNLLAINVSYGGGCKYHEFLLYAISLEKEICHLKLYHNSNNDVCKKEIRETVNFDLFPLKEKYKEKYNLQDKVIFLSLENKQIRYSL